MNLYTREVDAGVKKHVNNAVNKHLTCTASGQVSVYECTDSRVREAIQYVATYRTGKHLAGMDASVLRLHESLQRVLDVECLGCLFNSKLATSVS